MPNLKKDSVQNEPLSFDQLVVKINNQQSILNDLQKLNEQQLEKILGEKKTYLAADLEKSDHLQLVHIAARAGNLQAIKDLETVGADFSVTTSLGEKVRDLAEHHQQWEVVTYLSPTLTLPHTPYSLRFPNASSKNSGFGNTGYNPKFWQQEPKFQQEETQHLDEKKTYQP